MTEAAGRDLRLFTSESVTEGHPDKVADQISDAIVDEFLRRDGHARVAVEALVASNLVVIAGQADGRDSPDSRRLVEIVRNTIRRIGYVGRGEAFDADRCEVRIELERQSGDIRQGVDRGGAGDQGMMFGYACEETEELMPLPIVLAHRITARLTEARRDGSLPYLGPDGKSQVTVGYREDGSPGAVVTIVASCQHDDGFGDRAEREIGELVAGMVPADLGRNGLEILVNPTGQFTKGGPEADTGLTGRKIIVDTYGGAARHGGGCFSGKDPTKVDRSATYMARYVAKNVVAAGLARRAEVQLAYAIGQAEPVSVRVDAFGAGGGVSDARLERAVRKTFRLTPEEIIEHLDLRRPIYEKTASGGHFGRAEEAFTWERTDRAEDLKQACG